jgi:hypothetical protein
MAQQVIKQVWISHENWWISKRLNACNGPLGFTKANSIGPRFGCKQLIFACQIERGKPVHENDMPPARISLPVPAKDHQARQDS